MKKVFIDSDVFVRDLRYPRGTKSECNQRFLLQVKTKKISGVTSIFNILEIVGILSFNLSPEKLLELYGDFCHHYNIQIFFPADSTGNLEYDLARVFRMIQKKQSLGDAQISYVVERFADRISSFVSWNKDHFLNTLPVPVLSPEDFAA